MRARALSEMTTVFRRTFVVEAPPPRARLSVRMFRDGEVILNGRSLPLGPTLGNWKHARVVDASALIRPGTNEISVRVRNVSGPPALWMKIEGAGLDVMTGAGWEASVAGAAWRPVRIASEPPVSGPIDPAGIIPSPSGGLREAWPVLVALALGSWFVGLGLSAVARGRRARLGRFTVELSPFSITLVAVAFLWAALFLNNGPVLPLQIGFDAGQHLDYVRYVLERHAIPLADEGWQMFQPPLYYVLSALGLAASGRDISSPGAWAVVRAIGFASALAIAVATGFLLRLRYRDRPLVQVGGVLFAAFLPPVLYLSHFPTNELLAAALATASLLAALLQMNSTRWSLRRSILLGALLGLALLTKFSTLLLLPCVFGSLSWGALAAPREDRRGRFISILAVAASTVAVSGWHFARVWSRFGDPFVGGWEARPGMGWWLDPGFRTMSHFTRFGRVFDQPAFAGLGGFWDGIYSTMWGDGMLSGLAGTSPLPPWWSPSLQSAGYLLAFIPLLFLCVGFVRLAAAFVRRPSPDDGLILFVPILVLGALVVMSLRVPSVAQDKAFYGLMAIGPLSVILAAGMVSLGGRHGWRMAILLGALGCWAAASFATYWIDRSSANVRMIEAVSLIGVGDSRSGEAVLRKVLRQDPDNWAFRAALATVLGEKGNALDGEVEALLRPGEATPSLLARHDAIATWAETRGRTELARVQPFVPSNWRPILLSDGWSLQTSPSAEETSRGPSVRGARWCASSPRIPSRTRAWAASTLRREMSRQADSIAPSF